jgi:hypothetical protein
MNKGRSLSVSLSVSVSVIVVIRPDSPSSSPRTSLSVSVCLRRALTTAPASFKIGSFVASFALFCSAAFDRCEFFSCTSCSFEIPSFSFADCLCFASFRCSFSFSASFRFRSLDARSLSFGDGLRSLSLAVRCCSLEARSVSFGDGLPFRFGGRLDSFGAF